MAPMQDHKITQKTRPAWLCTLALLCSTSACSTQNHKLPPHSSSIALPERLAGRDDASFVAGHKALIAAAGDMDAEAFFDLYAAPSRVKTLSYDPLGATDLGKILKAYPLSESQKSALSQNGFVVIRKHAAQVPEHVYKDVYTGHMPVMITSDSVLYALHRSYDSLLKDLELRVLVPELTSMLKKMHESLGAGSTYSSASLASTVHDVDIYLTVARSLLSGALETPALSSTDSLRVEDIMDAASALSPATLGLFGDEVKYDYSQLKPRGHYTETPELQRYFQAMMWLGRTEMRLVSFQDAKRRYNGQAFAAALMMTELLESSNARPHWERLDKVIAGMVGERDSMDPTEMRRFTSESGLAGLAAIPSVDSPQIADALVASSYGTQRIMNQIIKSDPNEAQAVLPRVFLLMGQRFVLDSWLLSRSSYDRLLDPATGKKILRMMPSDLDVQFALGSNVAGEELSDELSKFNYAHRLHELRYIVDGYPESFWSGNMYNAWLDAIRGLNSSSLRDALPETMRTRAWDQKTLNTQLASWAELRHDTLLYAKQSYSASISCEYPNAFVEPVPVFFDRMATLAAVGAKLTKDLSTDGFDVARANSFFENMKTTMKTLATIAHKELEHQELDTAEKNFLKATIEVEMVGCGETQYDGWFAGLFYEQSDVANFKPTIADVHTTPTDKVGNDVGWVLHAGTGGAGTMIFTVNHGGQSQAFVGPVSSYYSFRTDAFKRLDDSEWQMKLFDKKPPAPRYPSP